MTPSVICLALLLTNGLAVLTLFLMRGNHRRKVLALKKHCWEDFLTERKGNYDRGWENGFEFHRILDEVTLRVALEYVEEGDLDMTGNQDRQSQLIGRMIQKIDSRYELFNAAMIASGNDPVVNKVAFYTTMIQIMKDNPSDNPGTAEIERHVVKYLIRLRNTLTNDMAKKYDAAEVDKG